MRRELLRLMDEEGSHGLRETVLKARALIRKPAEAA